VNKWKTASSKQTAYQKQRQMNIEKNAMRFQELGLSKLTNELIHNTKGCSRKEQNSQMHIDQEYQEYMLEKMLMMTY